MKQENIKNFTTSSKLDEKEVSDEIKKIIERQNSSTKEKNSVSPLEHKEETIDMENPINGEAEIVPLNTNIIVKPYKINPYSQMQFDENGMIIHNDSPHKIKNTDSGEMEEAEEFIKVARVKEVGPDVKNVVIGDDIYYTAPSATPLPFLKLGMMVVPEQRVLAIVNTNVKERWNK